MRLVGLVFLGIVGLCARYDGPRFSDFPSKKTVTIDNQSNLVFGFWIKCPYYKGDQPDSELVGLLYRIPKQSSVTIELKKISDNNVDECCSSYIDPTAIMYASIAPLVFNKRLLSQKVYIPLYKDTALNIVNGIVQIKD